MFRQYEKTYRILVPQINVKGKHFLSSKETRLLLGGKVTVTEKIDGANSGVIRTKEWFRLQKKGSLVDASEHEQFNFFKAWSAENYEKLTLIPRNLRVYGELMRVQHTILYNQLPDWFLVFAIYDDKKQKYLDWHHVELLSNDWGLATVPLIAQDMYLSKMALFDMIPSPSNYGEGTAEGLVVWNYRQQMRGKLVRPEFMKRMEEHDHWTQQKMVFNELKR